MAAGQADSGKDTTPTTASGNAGTKGDKPLPPAAKRKKKSPGAGGAARSDAGAGPSGGRYTAPVPAARKGPSPRWVPVLMFGLWVLGLALILLNYMGLLPGSSDGGNGLYLVGGLALILGGIVTATQYR